MQNKPWFYQRQYCENGYTLLELLLVIIILGVLATLGISYYQKQVQATKVTQASLQMQEILQAAVAYYVDNSCWPGSNQNSVCKPCASNAPDFANYLPVGVSHNPFSMDAASQYVYRPEPKLCQKFQVLSGALPSRGVLRQLVASLPSAGTPTTTIYPNQVLAETAVPSSRPAQQAGYILQYVGTATANMSNWSNTFSFTCPAGWQAIGVVAPINFQMTNWTQHDGYCDSYGPGSNLISILSATQKGLPDFPPIQPITCSGNPAQCSYDATFQSRRKLNKLGCPTGNEATGTVRFIQLGFCVNPQISAPQKITPLVPVF